jgi:heat shock protein HtpX
MSITGSMGARRMPAPLPERMGHRVWNYFKTAALLAAMTALALVVGQAVGGAQGLLYAGFFVIVMNVGSFWFSDRIALAMHRARPLSRNELPWLFDVVEDLARRYEMPMPRVYLIPTPSPNAFATGRSPNHAAIAVTEGILHLCTERELAGVLAHELGHVKNRDTLTSTIAATIAGVISFAAQMLFWYGGMLLGGGRGDRDDRGGGFAQLGVLLVAPLAATLLQLAISRGREYEADATGARVLGDPDALADALSKLARGVAARPYDRAPATAHLFVVNPLSGRGVMSLFSTHPPLDERIRRLRSMGR